MRGFRRERGVFVAEVDTVEREVIASVLLDVAQLLDERAEEPARGQREGDSDDLAGAEGLDPVGLDLAGADAAGTPAPDPGLDWPSPGPLEPPDDPAVHRLLPDASSDDPELAAEFRRLTEDGLRQVKADRLRRLRAAVLGEHGSRWPAGALVVEPGEAMEVAATLTDVRLVLAERLGLEDEEAADELYAELERRPRGRHDPQREARRYLGSVYAALSWWQETLLALMLADLPEDRPDVGPLGSG